VYRVLICCCGCAYLVHVCFVTFVLILLSFIGLCFCCLSLCANFSVLFLCSMILDGGCVWVLLVMQHSLIRLFSSRVFFVLFCGQTYLLLCFILSGLLQAEDKYCGDYLLFFVVVYLVLLFL